MMDYSTTAKLRKILRRSRAGERTSKAEDKYCESCWKKFPDEYRKLCDEVRIEDHRRLNPLYDTPHAQLNNTGVQDE